MILCSNTTHLKSLKNIDIVTRSTNIITMNIRNITQFLRMVTDLQPCTAPMLISMHDSTSTPPKKIHYKLQNSRTIFTNRRINNSALLVQVIQKS